jgi:glutamine amidotransferase
LAEFLIANKLLTCKILIGHLRAASIGRPAPRNTHPWTRELGGKEYVLAHVGAADKHLWQTVKLGRFQPVGENCAEYILCHLLAKIEEHRTATGMETWNSESFARLHQVVAAVNEVQTTSHLLSDGTYLFAYSSKTGTSLSYVKREMASSQVGHARGRMPPEPARGVIVARNGHNLGELGGQWTRIQPGQLVVFRDGKPVYASDVEP